MSSLGLNFPAPLPKQSTAKRARRTIQMGDSDEDMYNAEEEAELRRLEGWGANNDSDSGSPLELSDDED